MIWRKQPESKKIELMLKVNCARWSHSKELFREEALKAEHNGVAKFLKSKSDNIDSFFVTSKALLANQKK